MRSGLLIAALLSVASVARAEDRPRSIWLECKAPAVWPARTATPVRLSCRVEASGPAFWQTVNPFTVERASEVLDPFAVDVTPRYIDVFETGRYAKARAQRPTPPPARKHDTSDELMSPFEVYPDELETINPFVEPRDEADRVR
jgi:hypothetical protein